MPGFSRSGPMGCGPGTGRGMGPCGAGATNGFGIGAGRGQGFGRGLGRTFGRGFGQGPAWSRNSPRKSGFFDSGETGSEDRSSFTVNALKRSRELLEQELALVNHALADAEKNADSPKDGQKQGS